MTLGYPGIFDHFCLSIPFQQSINGIAPMLDPPLQTDDVTHKSLYTEQFLSARAFTERGLCTEKLLHTDAFTHRGFYAKRLLHAEARSSAEPALLLFELLSAFLFPLPDHPPFAFPFPSICSGIPDRMYCASGLHWRQTNVWLASRVWVLFVLLLACSLLLLQVYCPSFLLQIAKIISRLRIATILAFRHMQEVEQPYFRASLDNFSNGVFHSCCSISTLVEVQTIPYISQKGAARTCVDILGLP